MKFNIKAFSAAALGGLLPLTAQDTQTRERTGPRDNNERSTKESLTTTSATFNPAARTKVVKYFEAYKDEPFGLPPAWVAKVRAKELPAAWRTTRIAPGVVITQKDRSYLMAAPPELMQVLPTPRSEDVRYFMAGGNVVAVDKSYKVVDSIQIPSVKITAEE